MTRPNIHVWALKIAQVVATRGTCARRKVGCVLLDDMGFILSTGYNGPASGEAHCIDYPCPGAQYPPGQGLSVCEAIHAEANALMTCRDINLVSAIYVTSSPCLDCVKMLLRTSSRSVYFIERYAHDDEARLRWEKQGRIWEQISI